MTNVTVFSHDLLFLLSLLHRRPRWQAAQERIFKAMDADHDGAVTFEEMQAFMHGH